MNAKERDAPYKQRKVFVVYALADPETDRIRFVGSSKHPHERLIQLRSESKNGARNTDQSRWLGALLDRALSPEIIVLEEVAESAGLRQRRDVENMWASRLVERGEPLANFTGSGVGHVHVLLDVAGLAAVKKIEDEFGLNRDGAALHAILEFAKSL